MLPQTKLETPQVLALSGRLRGQISTLKGRKVMVIGDIGLDEYVLGDVRRISPEAPVPVVEVRSQDARLGLAANVAQNISSLGGEPLLVSVIGRDRIGEELGEHLKAAKVSSQYLVQDEQRPTTRKLRVLSGHHHIVRVDYELKKYLRPETEEQLLQKIKDLVPACDAIIIEDYAKGVLSERVIQESIGLGHALKKKVLVDPNPSTPARFYRGADLMTPNQEEAFKLSGLLDDELRSKENFILDVGERLREIVQSPQLIITRGREGMTLFSSGGAVHLPTFARQVFDVTGAGDTVIAALALAWSSGFSLEEACVLANFAAGVVVGKIGCVPCSITELVEYMDAQE